MRKAIFILILSFLIKDAFPQRADTLRFITYNIHHAEPPAKSGTIDVDAFIALFKKFNVDVIALQEVDVHTRRSGGIHEAKAIADALGMQFFFAKAIDHDGGEYGVALLSKYALQNAQTVRLPMDSTVKGEQRVLAMATIRLASGRSVTIGCTHLDHQRNPKSREVQMALIDSIAKMRSTPFVMAGDFNAEPKSTVLQLFEQGFQNTCMDCPPTFPAAQPARTIDYIGFRKTNSITIGSHQVLPEAAASDHRPVLAVLYFH